MRTLPLLILIMASACHASGSGPEPVALGDVERTLGEGPLIVELLKARAGKRDLHVIRATIPRAAKVRVKSAAAPLPLAQVVGPITSVVAINGGFYDDTRRPMGLVIEDGNVKSAASTGGGSGVFVVDKAGPRVVFRDAVPPAGVQQAVQSIDRLVDKGISKVGARASGALDARSAVAVLKDGTVRLYVVFAPDAIGQGECDARGCRLHLDEGSSSTGVSLFEFATFLVAEGADSALNLDGGYSTSFLARLSGAHLEVVAHGATINAITARPGP